MKNIHIYNGPAHSGKTTFLFNWIAAQKNVGGILQPVVDSRRCLYNIFTRQLKILELDPSGDEKNFDAIGKYKFSRDTFAWAQKLLLSCLSKELDWLIIDEIGPLEIEGKGFEPALSKILSEHEKFYGNILIVVRKGLFQKVKAHYHLANSSRTFKEA